MHIKDNSPYQISISDFALNLVEYMYSLGFTPKKLNLTPCKFHRFTSIGCKRKCCEYLIFENYRGAMFRCWRRSDDYHIYLPNKRHMTALDKEEIRRMIRKDAEERKKKKEEAARRSYEMLLKAKPAEVHPYIKRKQIIPYNSYILDDILLIPATDSRGKLLTVQMIHGNGFKHFPKHSGLKGAMHIIGDLERAELILVCEGWATACTLAMCLGGCNEWIAIVSTFGVSNLYEVVKSLRTRFNHLIIMCADNDCHGDENIGVIKAQDAASKFYNIKVIYPCFDGLDLSKKPTDYNDLYLMTDINHVTTQVLDQLEQIITPKNEER